MVPKCEISISCFLRSILVGDLGTRQKKFLSFQDEADIRLFVFLKHVECALKNVLHMLSMR